MRAGRLALPGTRSRRLRSKRRGRRRVGLRAGLRPGVPGDPPSGVPVAPEPPPPGWVGGSGSPLARRLLCCGSCRKSFRVAQVTPHRRGVRNPVNEYVERVSEELRRRGHEVTVLGYGDRVKERLRGAEFDIIHVHDPFAPRVSSTALRNSYSLNVATFHAPQERVLSTQVARPLVEILFGRLDARTVTSPATGQLLERYFPASYDLVEPAGPERDWVEVADEVEAIYRRLVARRRDPDGRSRGAAADRQAAADRGRPAHAHRPLARLCDAGRGAAGDRSRPRPRRDRDHRPQRGLRRARGAAHGRGDGRHQGDRRGGDDDRRAGRGDRPLPRAEDPARDDDGRDDRRDPRAGRAGLRAPPLRPFPLGARLRAICSRSSRRSTCSRSSTRGWR